MMLTPVQRAQLATARTSSVTSLLGVYIRRSGAYAVVAVGGQEVTVANVGQYPPQPGDSVQLESRNGKLVMTGPALAKPATATVTDTALTANTIQVTDDDSNNYEVGYLSTYTPVLGDQVSVNWFSYMAEGKPSQVHTPTTPGTGGGGGLVPFDLQFPALGSGSFGSRWFNNDVYSSASNTGAWFYGPAPADSLKDTAIISRVEIYANIRSTIVAGTSNVGIHTSLSQPGGNVSFTGTTPIQLVNGWNTLPTSFGDYLKSNYGGVGISHGHYIIFRGTQSDSLSGRLRIQGTQ